MSVFHPQALNFSHHSAGLLSHTLSVSLGVWQVHTSLSPSSAWSPQDQRVFLTHLSFFYTWPSHPSYDGLVLPSQSRSQATWTLQPSLTHALGPGSVLFLCPIASVCDSESCSCRKFPTTRESRCGRFLPATSPDTLPTQIHLKCLLPY